MSAYLERPRREFQLPTWPLPVQEYTPTFTRNEKIRAERKANVGTRATVLAMQSEGLRIGLRAIDDLRASPRSLEEWALLQSGAMLGSAYHMFQWEGTPLTHRKLQLPELATIEGEFADPDEYFVRAKNRLADTARITDQVATNERVRGRISKEAYVNLAHQLGTTATHVAVLPVHHFTERDDPVAIQQEVFETVHSAWNGALSMYSRGDVNRLPSISQLADNDSPLRRYIRDPKSGISDEVSGAVERAAGSR